jgi:hypothetical protein
MNDPYSANLRLEVEMLRLQVSELKDTVKMLWQERTPRILSPALQIKLGKTDASIAKNASGTVSVWAGSTEADTLENITSHNRLGLIGSGKWVISAYFNGKWYIIAGEC